ncbi:hypothetical protein AAVH_32136 [Aphelenchoides avenae]|nr:hypothetical protein AAVH_32136 [Aphelenchus avenae]
MYLAHLLRRIKRELGRFRERKVVVKKDARGSTLAEADDGCKICTNAFDNLGLLPVELVCGHLACHECAMGIWLRTSSLSCPFSPACASLHDDRSEEDFLVQYEQNEAEVCTTQMLTYDDQYACCGYECLASEELVESLMPPDLFDVLLTSPKRSFERSWWTRLSGIPYGL